MSSRAAWRLETLGYTNVSRYVAGKVDWLANGLPSEGQHAAEPRIRSLAQRDVPTCRIDERIADVRQRVAASGFDLCVAINEQRVVLGDLRDEALQRSPPDACVGEVMNPGPSTYRPDVSVEEMRQHMTQTRAERVYVADADGRLIGLLRREAVFA
ncbi:MAG TPA: CBS domain-containing protein [Chloroflexota bacterium]